MTIRRTDARGASVRNWMGSHLGRALLLLLVLVTTVGAVRAIPYSAMTRLRGISDELHATADELAAVSARPTYDLHEADHVLAEMKLLIARYEKEMVFAESPYPGEILLGTTPAGDSNKLETILSSRYSGLFKEIRIRRTGSRASYLRVNDIEITHMTARGPVKELFNEAGRVKLYRSSVFQLALPRPMDVRRIRISISHESTGLEITGIPYEAHSGVGTRIGTRIGGPSQGGPVHGSGMQGGHGIGDVVEQRYAGEVLLGTTPAGKSSWLETLCDKTLERPVREIRIRRTGNRASYLRINDIELTYLTPAGPQQILLNENARAKLYSGGVFAIALPRPMRLLRVRIRIDHESTGLEVYAVH